jgi:hypothetical protein
MGYDFVVKLADVPSRAYEPGPHGRRRTRDLVRDSLKKKQGVTGHRYDKAYVAMRHTVIELTQ